MHERLERQRAKRLRIYAATEGKALEANAGMWVDPKPVARWESRYCQQSTSHHT